MLYLYTGTDRGKSRAALQKELARFENKKYSIVRVTDAHTVPDLSAALQGGGMFGGSRVVVFENVLLHEEMAPALFAALQFLSDSSEPYFILEEKVDAPTRKKLEKYAEKSERFDAAKGERDTGAFELGYAMQRRDKKAFWVGYMRELSKDSAPEMIHGILFWAAKQQLLRNTNDVRAQKLVARLAELPHEARRKGFDLEYALEHFALSGT